MIALEKVPSAEMFCTELEGTPQELMDYLMLKTIEGFRIYSMKQIHPTKWDLKMLRFDDWAELEKLYQKGKK